MARHISNVAHRMRGRGALAVALVLLLATAVQATGAERARRIVAVVPSKEFPTIQSGIDGVVDGGRVLISPGWYEESLLVVGKRITLQGSGVTGDERTVLIGSEQDQGTIIFGPAGGGRVGSMVIQGGAYGLASEAGSPAAVDVRDVRITDTGRGIYGAYSDLSLRDVVINDTAWNGMSVTELAGSLLILDSRILHSGNVGLLIFNHVPSLDTILVDNATILGHPGGGIVVDGHGKDVTVTDSVIAGNGYAGVRFMFSYFDLIRDTIISNTHPRQDGLWGDGVVAVCSQVAVDGSNPVTDPPQFPISGSNLIELSDRVGLSAFGSLVSVGNTLFSNNLIDVHRASYPCGTSSIPDQLVDLGGTLCGRLKSDGFDAAACNQSGELQVPDLFPPETP